MLPLFEILECATHTLICATDEWMNPKHQKQDTMHIVSEDCRSRKFHCIEYEINNPQRPPWEHIDHTRSSYIRGFKQVLFLCILKDKKFMLAWVKESLYSPTDIKCFLSLACFDCHRYLHARSNWGRTGDDVWGQPHWSLPVNQPVAGPAEEVWTKQGGQRFICGT